MNNFRYGRRSLGELEHVKPELRKVAIRMLELSPIDITITQGIRTLDEQKALVASGASRTLKSRHLPQEDGLAHAFDFAPYVEGRVRWDWPLFDVIAEALHEAVVEFRYPVVWGAAWGRLLKDYDSAAAAKAAYIEQKRQQMIARGWSRPRIFLDGPHVQWGL